MEFTVEKSILLNGIQTVQNAVTQKSSLPILANVLLEVEANKLRLTATDLDMGISSVVPILDGEKGDLTIPARKFFDIVKSLPEGGDIRISLKKNNSVTIKSGRALFKIIGLPKEDFPTLPVFEDKDSLNISQKTLKKMINLTDFAISRDDARHVLTGTLITVSGDHLSVIATDGRRMAVVNNTLSKNTLIERRVIIPMKTIQEVKRILSEEGDVKIQFSDNQVLFSFASSFIISRVIEGEFPDYRKVIPERSEKVLTVSREEFLDAAKRVSILTDQESQAVKLTIQKTKMTLSKNTPYLGEAKEEINIDYNSEETMDIGFNPRYLIDVLKNIDDEEIYFEVNEKNKPGVIRKGEEYQYVVLPMQISS